MRFKIAPTYEDNWLEVERPSPLSDRKIEVLQQDVLSGKLSTDISDQVYADFKAECVDWFRSSKLNKIEGLEFFKRVDIITGCTQSIDTQYMKGPVQILRGDYRYHERLNPNIEYSQHGSLKGGVPLILAQPFPSTGDTTRGFSDLMEEAFYKDVQVHIDGAWMSCSRDIRLNLIYIPIETVSLSLSKGMGLGWNRIGLRFTNNPEPDAITIMNDFKMNNRAPAMIALHFIRNLEPDYLWNTHGERYYKVCSDFNLTPTKSIYLALRDGHPVGVSPLIRYLEENEIT
jgi:hypothetical protein